MTSYVLSEDADRDLDCIWDYIAEDSIDAADRWIVKLFAAFATIGDSPGIGHKREDLTSAGSFLACRCVPDYLPREVEAFRDRGSDAGRPRHS